MRAGVQGSSDLGAPTFAAVAEAGVMVAAVEMADVGVRGVAGVVAGCRERMRNSNAGSM